MDYHLKDHWEKIYASRQTQAASWHEDVPVISLEFIRSFHLSKNASIIDIGGGDSRLADYLLDDGFTNITVLDISALSISRAKQRLGIRAKEVNWIESDILEFHPEKTFDIWHDRAAFHFFTNENDVKSYLEIAGKYAGKYLVIGTFSASGPEKCSGLPVKRYDQADLERTFHNWFRKIRCINADHFTPNNIKQNFTFCSFERCGSK